MDVEIYRVPTRLIGYRQAIVENPSGFRNSARLETIGE